ncbi:MAG: hypothetical protein IKC59_05785 [Clostridia bacterium]|nr:hypothetical protein [Clostridia bacterium]
MKKIFVEPQVELIITEEIDVLTVSGVLDGVERAGKAMKGIDCSEIFG